MTKIEAREMLESYYKYVTRKDISEHIWDAIDDAIVALGGKGDPTLDKGIYRIYYSVMKTNAIQTLEAHALTLSMERLEIPEIDAMQIAIRVMREDKR